MKIRKKKSGKINNAERRDSKKNELATYELTFGKISHPFSYSQVIYQFSPLETAAEIKSIKEFN